MELITIGITCYNAQATIERALKSASSQDYEKTEILIVDDCSSDESLNIINNYKRKNNLDFKIICHKTNKGPAGTRNTIINNSNGKYIAFFDVNTFPNNIWLEKSYNLIKNLNLDYLIGTRITLSNTYLKRINKFSTYGERAYIAVTGTIILKN